jgi:hypothetical protein
MDYEQDVVVPAPGMRPKGQRRAIHPSDRDVMADIAHRRQETDREAANSQKAATQWLVWRQEMVKKRERP